MELWSRLAEHGYWKQPEDSMYDMATEKEGIEHIEEGMDPEKVEAIVIYRKDDGKVKKKVGGVSEEEMAERLEALMDKKEKEELEIVRATLPGQSLKKNRSKPSDTSEFLV